MFQKLYAVMIALEQLALIHDVTTEEGLRNALQQIKAAGETIGLDTEVLTKIDEALEEEDTFAVLLAVVRWAYGHVPTGSEEGMISQGETYAVLMHDESIVEVEAESITDWLPLVTQLITLIQQLRKQRHPAT